MTRLMLLPVVLLALGGLVGACGTPEGSAEALRNLASTQHHPAD